MLARKLQGGVVAARNEIEQEQKYMSALPFMPPLNEKTLQQYYILYAAFFLSITLFGALVAPIAELKLGLGGEQMAIVVLKRRALWAAG